MSDALQAHAGLVPPRQFRVVVIEADARIHTKDFSDFAVAVEYADDAAGEQDVMSAVFDTTGRVHTGRGYFMARRKP